MISQFGNWNNGHALIVFFVASATLAMKTPGTFAQSVHGEMLLRHDFPAPISEIAECTSHDGKKQLVIIGGSQGVILHDDEKTIVQFPLKSCAQVALTQLPGRECLVYCRGTGFSPVYLADVTGKMHWEFNAPGTIWVATATPTGNFFVGTSRGTKRLSLAGMVEQEYPEELVDIRYFPAAPLVTKTRHRFSQLSLDVRDLQLRVIKSFPITDASAYIVMFDWPVKGALCYCTPKLLICLNADGRELHRIRVGNRVMFPNASVVHTPSGNSYLGVIFPGSTPLESNTLIIFSSQFRKVYEETLPPSGGAIKTMKWKSDSERLLVGAGSSDVKVYTISDAE